MHRRNISHRSGSHSNAVLSAVDVALLLTHCIGLKEPNMMLMYSAIRWGLANTFFGGIHAGGDCVL
eukprot:12084991-Ditylum_brightwellii.AAC.1